MGYLQDGTGLAEGHLLCTICAKTYQDRRACPVHPEEPLLDIRNDEVVLRLADEDDRGRLKRMGRWATLLGVPAMLLGIVLTVVVQLGGGLGTALTFFLASGAVGLGVAIGKRSFQPRYARWTKRLEPDPDLSAD